MKNTRKAFIYATLLPLVLASLASCTPVQETRGNLLQNHQILQVQEGIDTKADVARKLGSPTTVAPFDRNTWYYLGQVTEKKGIFDPKVIEERVVLVQFDEDSGTATTILEVEKERIDIPLSKDKTKTGGNETTILQELLGNIGKFNAPGTSPGAQ